MAEPASVMDGASAPGKKSGRGVSTSLRDLWAIDERQRVVQFVQTPLGKLVLVAAFFCIAKAVSLSLMGVLAAAACAYLPRYRSQVMAVAALALLIRHAPGYGLTDIGTILTQEGLSAAMAPRLAIGALVVFFACTWGALALARRRKDLLFVRRPVVCLLLLEATICVLACSPLASGVVRAALWAFLCVLTAYTWFVAYAFVDQRSRSRGSLLFQMGILYPFWGSTATPYGKGAALMRKHEAKTPEDLAVTQLKALKLLVWSTVLLLLEKAIVWIGESQLNIPLPASAMTAFIQGQPYPIAVGWGSLIWATLHDAVALAVYGHQFIAIARLAGYRLPRNMWRPLEARTLADFWNRYYYYFKELLVEFFFFPTFLKFFRNHTRLRLFFATFMAAGVGNAIFHFVRDIKYVVTMGLQGALESYTSYLFYCLTLAVAIGISQARVNAGRKLPTGFAGTLWSVLCVWSVVVLLRIFGDESRSIGLLDRFSFLFSLFGVNR